MDKVATMIRLLIMVFCAMLFLAGALWNLCLQPESAAEPLHEIAVADEGIQAQSFSQDDLQTGTAAKQQPKTEQTVEQRLAKLRVRRDTARQALYHSLESLEYPDKEQVAAQYTQLEYQEQTLELLLNAKGVKQVLAVLGPNHANIIVPKEQLHSQYEKLYDLVLRNTEYDETQIILVPLE